MSFFIAIAAVAACVSIYFFVFQTGLGESGLHNHFYSELSMIVSFAAGILACVAAIPYKNQKNKSDNAEDISTMELAIISIALAVVVAALSFVAANNLSDQENGPVSADHMIFINKMNTSNILIKKVSNVMFSPGVRLTFSNEEGNQRTFILTNRDFNTLSEDIKLETGHEYKISYYPNSNTLVSISG
jgi:hypothetical protein